MRRWFLGAGEPLAGRKRKGTGAVESNRAVPERGRWFVTERAIIPERDPRRGDRIPPLGAVAIGEIALTFSSQR